MLSGYYDHHLAYLYEIRHDQGLFEESCRNWLREIKPIIRNPFLQTPDVFIKNPGQRDHIYLDAQEFARYLIAPWHEPFSEERYSSDLLRNLMLNQLLHEGTPALLHEEVGYTGKRIAERVQAAILDRHSATVGA